MVVASAQEVGLPGVEFGADGRPTAVPSDLLITLVRSNCRGVCPVYEVSVQGDGTVVYEGRRFVAEEGRRTGKVDPDGVADLLVAFRDIDFFGLHEEYASSEDGCQEVYTDEASAVTAIIVGGETKRVDHYHGCHGLELLERLRQLEDAIDRVANTATWVGPRDLHRM